MLSVAVDAVAAVVAALGRVEGARAPVVTTGALHKGEATRVVDLAGRTPVPGLIDGHAHFAQFGTQAIG